MGEAFFGLEYKKGRRVASQAEPVDRGAGARRPVDGRKVEKIIAAVLDEAHKWQVEGVMDTLEEGPEGLYKRPPY